MKLWQFSQPNLALLLTIERKMSNFWILFVPCLVFYSEADLLVEE